ncbi:hypothetical protein [Flexithrix dorotheae]|uniref:hypothetical protein n=1 Tax=Flexithrix dorotheae TaxID=70993 RepID=UPI00036D7FE6|nr:hypothetical protein [Flexithrix dorotheae]
MKIRLIFILLGISVIACKNNSDSKEEKELTKTEIQAETKIPINQVEKELEEKPSTDCKCFNGIGSSEDDKPIIISKFSNGTSLSLCGYFDKEKQDKGLIMSEFNIFNCKTGSSLVEYGAVQTCRIEQKKDSLIIRELKYLPVGKNWNWELIQIARQEITQKEGEIIVSNQIPETGNFDINKTTQIEFLNSLKRGGGFDSEWESDLGKLEVLSLLGNDEAWEILKNYEDFTGAKTDGALAEQWKDAIATIEWIKEK